MTLLSITQQSQESRVFYFHEFIYFTDTLSFELDAVEILVNYFLDLLIIFDEILIPAEHLNISKTEHEAEFKRRFVSHTIIQELIYRGKVVTTIWSQCSSPQEHYEASARYLSVIGASNYSFQHLVRPYLSGMQIYQRNPTHQSGKARSYTRDAMSYDGFMLDALRYEDGAIQIGFSHERLLLGDGSQRFTDEEILRQAKRSYIRAMPDGNGRVFRSSITSLETFNYGNGFKFTPIGEFPGGVNPLLLSYEPYSKILNLLSFVRPSFHTTRNPKWLDWFIGFINSGKLQGLRSTLFRALSYISTMKINEMADVDQALKYVHVLRYWNLAKLIWNVGSWPSQLISLWSPVHEFILRQKSDRFYYFSALSVEEYNAATQRFHVRG